MDRGSIETEGGMPLQSGVNFKPRDGKTVDSSSVEDYIKQGLAKCEKNQKLADEFLLKTINTDRGIDETIVHCLARLGKAELIEKLLAPGSTFSDGALVKVSK